MFQFSWAVKLLALCAMFAGLGPVNSAMACGEITDCEVPSGSYRIRLPQDPAPGPLSAIMFMHGWRGSADRVMKHKALEAAAQELGVALIAPNGRGRTWSFPSSPSQRRDEFAFFDALTKDVEARFGVDPKNILVSGFSLGGSMAWSLACHRGDVYKGFAPFAGAFWEPLPPECPNPAATLLHTHGEGDTVVPIEGRPIGARAHQGDVHESFAAITQSARAAEGPSYQDDRGYDCQSWARAGDNAYYEFCRHEGGHIYRPAWLKRAWRMLKSG